MSIPEGTTFQTHYESLEFEAYNGSLEEFEINGAMHHIAAVGYGFFIAVPVAYKGAVESGEEREFMGMGMPEQTPILYHLNRGENEYTLSEYPEFHKWGPGL